MKHLEFTDTELTSRAQLEFEGHLRDGHVRVIGFEPVWVNINREQYEELTTDFLKLFPGAEDTGLELDFLRDDYSGFVPLENHVTVYSEDELLDTISRLERKYLTEGKCNTFATFFRIVILITDGKKSATYILEKPQNTDWVKISPETTPKAWAFIQQFNQLDR